MALLCKQLGVGLALGYWCLFFSKLNTCFQTSEEVSVGTSVYFLKPWPLVGARVVGGSIGIC